MATFHLSPRLEMILVIYSFLPKCWFLFRKQRRTEFTWRTVLINNWSDDLEYVEEVNILLINRANKVIGIYNVSKGGRSEAVVDSRVIFTAALEGGATGIILSHYAKQFIM